MKLCTVALYKRLYRVPCTVVYNKSNVRVRKRANSELSHVKVWCMVPGTGMVKGLVREESAEHTVGPILIYCTSVQGYGTRVRRASEEMEHTMVGPILRKCSPLRFEGYSLQNRKISRSTARNRQIRENPHFGT